MEDPYPMEDYGERNDCGESVEQANKEKIILMDVPSWNSKSNTRKKISASFLNKPTVVEF